MKRVSSLITCLFFFLVTTWHLCESACPRIIEGRSPSNGSCLESCQRDIDCSGIEKCCPTSCGGHICTSGGLDVRKNECEVIVCGANAECVLDSADSPSLCKCKPGFSGDPNDPLTGCTKSSKLKLMCDYKNKSYGIEESFFDGCDHKCICTEALEVDCTPRCPLPSSHETGTSDPLCSLIEDPKDPCCKIVACESRSVFQTTPLIDPTLNVSSLSTLSSVVIDVGNGSANTIGVNEPLHSDGCRSQDGHFYKKGDSFFEGCESKCSCRDSGNIQCEPRCSLFQGFDGSLCQLIPDPSDLECCKIAVCESELPQNSSSLVLDSVEARNSSTVKIKVVMDPSLLIQGESSTSSSPSSSSSLSSIHVVKPQIDLLLSRIDEELHDLDHGEENKLEWIRREVDGGSMRQVGPKEFEFEVSSLKPATEYLMKIIRRVDNVTSNTVLVRTFPPGIDSSFNGCFHGNKTYEVGQIFFDGCAYKCTCREGGIRECEERCPVYVDTVGYENCVWKPAPDDPCCTIPVCDQNSSTSSTTPKVIPSVSTVAPISPIEPFCTYGEEIFALGQTWQDSSKCIKKSCTCLLSPNGTTSVQCTGGCAEIPQAAFKPTHECPKPSLVTPDDPCLCPYVICHKSRNPISPPPRLPNSGRSSENIPKKEPGCELKGRRLEVGEEAYDGCRAVCHCGSDGELNCALIECPHHFDSRLSECLEWDNDPDFEPTPPNCCPRNKCKEADHDATATTTACHFGGLIIENMKQIPPELLPCGTRCICISGNMTCENKCPVLSEMPPPNLPCSSQMAFQGHMPGDQCCLHWLCRNTERPVLCERNGIQYNLNQEWDETTPADGLSISTRRKCHCRPGSGSQPIVHCGPAQCPQITERHLRSSPECPFPVIVAPEGTGVMCPYVICNHSAEETGNSLDHVSVIAMNATSVRVRFTLPHILVGLLGHAELVFTTQPTLPRHEWTVQKFARPKRLFDTPNIEYHLSNLTPDTTYYFQIRIIVEALQSGPESEIYKLRMPPLSESFLRHNTEPRFIPIPMTSSTTTTTTMAPTMARTTSTTMASTTTVATSTTMAPTIGTSPQPVIIPDMAPYYVALTIVSLFASVTGIGFVTLLCVLLRSKSSYKAPITRAPSESAYDNPTYKTYNNERPGHDHRNEPLKNGHTNGLTIVSQS